MKTKAEKIRKYEEKKYLKSLIFDLNKELNNKMRREKRIRLEKEILKQIKLLNALQN